MKQQLISFETARLAKEKGFNIEVYAEYNESSIIQYFPTDWGYNEIEDILFNANSIEKCFSAPTQSLLQKWLREIYRIDVIILPNTSSNDVFLSIIPSKTYSNFLWKDLESMDTITNNYKTYEEALEVGLQEGLKLIL